MTKKYEYLEHTADAKFIAYGTTLDEKFENASYAMFNIIVDTKKVKDKIKKQINIEAKTERGLIYDFLNEQLFLFETEGFVLSKICELKVTGLKGQFKLDATLLGDLAKNYDVKCQIKAVTYNDFELAPEHLIMVMDL